MNGIDNVEFINIVENCFTAKSIESDEDFTIMFIIQH